MNKVMSISKSLIVADEKGKKGKKKIPACFNPLQPSLNLLSAKSVLSVCRGRFSVGRIYRRCCSPFLRPEPPLRTHRSEPSHRRANIVSSPCGAGVSKTSWQALIITSRRLWQDNNPSIVHSLLPPDPNGSADWCEDKQDVQKRLQPFFYPTFINCVWSSARGGFALNASATGDSLDRLTALVSDTCQSRWFGTVLFSFFFVPPLLFTPFNHCHCALTLSRTCQQQKRRRRRKEQCWTFADVPQCEEKGMWTRQLCAWLSSSR